MNPAIKAAAPSKTRAGPLPLTWQESRALALERICTKAQRARERTGKPLNWILRRAARRWNGKAPPGFPGRRLRLSPERLRFLFRHWWQNGCTPQTFWLAYGSGSRVLSAAMLARFIRFCAAGRRPSLWGAWTEFASRQLKRGRRLPGYYCARYHFPVSHFKLLQDAREKEETARREFNALRLAIIQAATAKITPPARRHDPDFQI